MPQFVEHGLNSLQKGPPGSTKAFGLVQAKLNPDSRIAVLRSPSDWLGGHASRALRLDLFLSPWLCGQLKKPHVWSLKTDSKER
jgi:hypothetical protein